jgi:uncharacterized protein (UPF0332 family)
MLNETRIKEAESNVQIYIKDGLLRKTKETTALSIFLKNAQDSLKASQLLIDNDIPLWAIVSAYYSMFYISNAVLLKQGYKTGEKIVHKVTTDAVIALIRKKLKKQILESLEEVQEEALTIAEIKSDELAESLDFERKKRSVIQYQTPKEDITAKAKTSFERAKEFLYEMEQLL